MSDRDIWSRVSSRTMRLFGNEPILLEEDGAALLVESGSIALFSVDVRDGAPAGPRRLLNRIGSGQAVFSVPVPVLHRLRLVVVPIKDAVIRRVALCDLWGDRQVAGSPVGSWVDEWVELLSRLLTVESEPKLPVKAAGEHQLELADGQALCGERNTVVWCRVVAGAVRCMGVDGAELHPESGPLPLHGDMWVQANGDAQLQTWATEDIEDAAAIAQGIAELHALVLRQLLADREREAEVERQRLRERDLVESQRSAEAIAELAAVIEPRDVRVTGDSPLLRALTAVGGSLGVEVRPPMKSERSSGQVYPVEAILRASRLRARRVQLSGDGWNRDCGALLAFTADEERRPVALIRRSSLRYDRYDPVEDTRVAINKQTARQLAGDAWMVYRPLPEGKLTLLDLFRFSLAGRRRELVMALGTGMIATLLGMITPQATAVLMDRAIPDADEVLLVQIGLGLLAAAIGQIVFRLSQGIVLLRLGLASAADTQAAVWDRLLRLRPSFFRDFSSGDLQSRVMAVSEVGRQMSGATLSSLFSGFLAVLNLGLLYYYSPRLTALALAIGLVVVAFTGVVGLFVRRNVRELVELDGRRFGMVVQLINGVGKLRVAGAGGRAFTHWMKEYGKSLKLWSETYRLEDRVYLFNQILPPISSAVLFLFAHQLLVEGRQASFETGLTLGTFLAFSAAFGAFLTGVISLSDTAVSLLDVFAKGRRVRPILEAEPEIDETKADPGKLTGRLAMSGVHFRYSEDGPTILQDVDLRAEPGEFVAVVGPSGSGKSTTLRLLLGFESPNEGAVSYDGQDLASLDVLAVRRQMGVVLQGGKLDAGSIFDNIACGTVLSLDDAWAAAEDAGFAEEVRQMPMGMHTIVSVGGGNLSGGQRQRLLIARALAQRPRILLFDEATSALDNRTQAIVSESLEKLNVTRVVVAHRLSTIRNADCIYVMEDGRVVQSGRYEELIETEGGLFARMMQRQLA